jgi:cell shape-determining protein MreC
MKRTFLTKRNALLSSTDISWGVYALSGAVIVLLVRLLVPNFFWQVFAPVFHSADVLTTESHRFSSSFGDTAKLALQNEKLLDENTALVSENQALLQKATSIGALCSSSVGSPTRGKNNTLEILAGVVARPPESPYDILVLAEGSRAGVALGMEAYGAGGVPVGVVSSVLTDFSRITLFSSPGMTTTGWVGHGNIPLTITGSGAGTMSASLARSTGITVGDIVFGPGPGMLPIGRVVRIDSDPSSPIITLRIMPALNLFSITWVFLRNMGTTLLP